MRIRSHASVDKRGRQPGDQGYNASEANASGGQPVGMSWFPGYAIDVGTGERLNMAFGEDSWLGADNGNDMIFNPSARIYSGGGGQGGQVRRASSHDGIKSKRPQTSRLQTSESCHNHLSIMTTILDESRRRN